jgi:hypothetical protein
MSTLSQRWVKLCLPGVKANCELIYKNTPSNFWLRLCLYFANAKDGLRAVFIALRPRGAWLSSLPSAAPRRYAAPRGPHDVSYVFFHDYIDLQLAYS